MRNISFLVVDSKMIAAVVKNIIVNRLGAVKVYTATTGSEAMQIVQQQSIDVIIADWQSPEVDGPGLLREIRSSEKYSEVPFVVTSNKGDKEFVVKAVQSGASQFVVKPFAPQKLEDAIRKAWNSAQKRNARRYSGLPKHSVKLDLGDKCLNAQVEDISRTGALIVLTYDEDIKLFGRYEMALEFDEIDEVGIISISPLPVSVVRLEGIDSYHPSTLKCQAALVFAVEMLDPESKKNLTHLFSFLKAKEKAQLKST